MFLEGPTWSDYSQAFYFSEMNFSSSQKHGPDSTIYKLVLPNTITTYLKHSGSNGLYAKEKSLYVMDHSTQSVSTIDIETKKKTILIDQYNNASFNSPNDMTMSEGGNIYFTDPDWQLGERIKEQAFTSVYKLDAEGKINLIDSNLDKPNGVALSPDQKILYVGDYNNRVSKYYIGNDGGISQRHDFISITSPDGIKVDCAGNIYISSHTAGIVYVYSPNGDQLGKIKLGPNVTNIAFGGDDRKTLLITTAKGLFKLKVNIAGLAI